MLVNVKYLIAHDFGMVSQPMSWLVHLEAYYAQR